MGKGKSIFSLITGLTVGAAAGAIAGILYAPKKVDETRKDLKSKAKGISAKGKKAFDNLSKSKLEPELKRVQNLIEENKDKFSDKLRKKVEEVREEVKEELEEVNEESKKTASKVKSKVASKAKK
jgi:gas vesicle protein